MNAHQKAETTETFGQMMSRALKKAGWSQAELARRLNVSPTYVGNVLADKSPGSKSGKRRQISIEDADRFAKALGVPLREARLAAGLAPPDDDQDSTNLKPRIISQNAIQDPAEVDEPTFIIVRVKPNEKMLLDTYRRLPEPKQVNILKYALELYQDEISPREAFTGIDVDPDHPPLFRAGRMPEFPADRVTESMREDLRKLEGQDRERQEKRKKGA